MIRRAGTDELFACAAPPEPGRGRPYALVNDSLVAAPLPVDYGWGAGSVCESVRGLAAWATALADGRVVSRDSYAQMTTSGRTASGAATPYGFALYVDTVAGHPVVWHGGLLPAYEAFVALYPRDGLVVALATNTISASGEMLGAEASADAPLRALSPVRELLRRQKTGIAGPRPASLQG